MPKSAEQTRAAVYGHLVGDAIGVPYEFTTPDPDRVVEVRGGGGHGQQAGTWSDDGALMLALLDSLLRRGFDPEHQGERALAWYDSGAYTPDGSGAFDIGTATAGALARLRAGVAAVDAGGIGERDQGNGSLMRILPIALLDRRLDDAEVVERAQLASRVTHGHPNCQVACALYVLVARTLLEDPQRGADPEAALALATDRLLAVYARQAALASVLRGLLAHRSEVGTYGGGWVLDTFWSAWEAFAASTSYRETIERCVRYGHDTDTTAAIAGGLAAIRWGLEEERGGVPGEWLAALRGRDLVEAILGRG
ncbi:MAG TPA: ADP-ribosylglycohydrolase family protein [Candidatus Limnocylindria bacterium]|nr:ADP-ribosylglycohydrolase family protein [Candidatus Limnocylindria bacterium]